MEHYYLEVEQEEDGRWLAEVAEVAGALAYGATPGEAAKAALDIAVAAGGENVT